MVFKPEIHHRQSMRLTDYDYSLPGAYFITICTKNKENLFGIVENNEIKLNEYGNIVKKCWYDLSGYYDKVMFDEYVVMPNHFHGIMIITENVDENDTIGAINNIDVVTNLDVNNNVGAIHESPLQENEPSKHNKMDINQRRNMLLSKIIGKFKMLSAKQINICRGVSSIPVWQRNYYDRIIRNDDELNKIREYIRYNPLNWENDEDYSLPV